jgi:type II secretory pathway component PulF
MDELTIIAFVLLALHVVLGYKKPAAAFVTAPLSALILGYAAVVTETPDNLILAPVLVVVTLGAIAVSARNQETRQWYHWWAWQLLITIALVLLTVVVIAGFSALGAGFVLPLFFIFGMVAVIASPIIYATVSRRTMAVHVFSTLGSIMRQNLPLTMALDCAVNGRLDGVAQTLKGIKSWLVKGYPLTEAIARGYPQCPPRVLALLAAGERAGQLPAALTAVEADLKSSAMERRRLQPVHPFYPVVILCFALLILLAIMTFVMPTYQAVLQELMDGTKLPAPTRMLLGISDAIVHPGNGWMYLGVLAALLGGIVLYRLSRRRRPEKPYVRTWIFDSVKWFLPVVHWFERNRSMVQVVELLRLSLNAGSPVNEAIRGTLQLDVNACFRSRLVCWLQRVERGQNVATSARRCGLGAALAWAFEGGAQTGNTPAVLEMLESHYRSNYSYRVNLTRFILWPLGIIALGVTVGFIVYGIFSPAVQVLSSMAGTIYP